MAWRIEFAPGAAREFRKLPKPAQMRIRGYLHERVLAVDRPRSLGRFLRGDKAVLWRYRVGDYRVICQLDEDQLRILVLQVGHRREVDA